MVNWDGFDISSLYQAVVSEYEKIIAQYSVKQYILNNHEKVYVIQDSFVIYLGLVDYFQNSEPHNFVVQFEELLNNDVFKFNFSQFARRFSSEERWRIAYKRFHGILGEPVRNIRDINGSRSGCRIESRSTYISDKIPELKLAERYSQWEGYLYHFIIYELSDSTKTGYAIYCSDNPRIHRTAMEKANDVEWCALDYYATKRRMNKSILGTDQDFSRYQFEKKYLTHGINCDGTIIDILVDKIERHKATGWKYKYEKKISPNKHCIAEHDLKYFWITRYVKSLHEVLAVGAQIFKDVHDGKYVNEPRYEYLIPENKWKSEQIVYELTRNLYKKYVVLYQHRPFFLKTKRGQLSYDVFICGLDVAIEYQGKQHFEPVEIFGGEAHYKQQVYRDRLKAKLSKDNGIALVYINYWEDISTDLIATKVEMALKERFN